MSKKENAARNPTCLLNNLARKSLKQQPCPNSQLKPPKCYIKITGSRYSGTFLLNIDDGLDDAIYHTMRDIEIALEAQTDPMGKPRVSPKNCLSSVFRCFGTNDLQTKAVCDKKKSRKPADCSLTATINKSVLGPLISEAHSSSFNPTSFPENSSENVMRDAVDVFRTTLEQFRKENLSSFGAPPSKLFAEPNFSELSPPTHINKAATDDGAKQSHQEFKKVSFIKFSQEEVLVIQPPKPSNHDPKELEVGIEVKPKTTASNVGQSIKLAKDKIQIGVQNGRGVLQINDGVPKRAIQMVIEEGADGKPSMKLSVKEESSQENEHLTAGKAHTNKIINQENKEESPKSYINGDYNGNESVSVMTNSNENTIDNRIIRNNVKHYKSVESQVSWARLEGIDTHATEEKNYKSESTQYQVSPSSAQPQNANRCVCCTVGIKTQTAVANAGNECADVSQHTVFNFPCFKKYSDVPKPRDSRMPYLVHSLYEPRSLHNSSAYFASDNPSTHRSTGKTRNSKRLKTSKRQVKKLKSSSFSSDSSSSSKCTKIFRDIREIGVKGIRKDVMPLGKKDASVITSSIGDFESILQNMCGSSYLYHHPEPTEYIPVNGLKHHGQVFKAQKHGLPNMSFDQSTQTNGCKQEVQASLEPTTRTRLLKNKTSKMKESGDGSQSRILRKKARWTKITASQRVDESPITSGVQDVLSSDSSESKQHKLVYSTFTASDETPLAKTSNVLVSNNWIPGKAKSLIGRKIFAAIEKHTNQSELHCDVTSTDSFVYPASKDASRMLLQDGNNVSVVNMALYDPTGPQLTDTIEKDPTGAEVINEPVKMSPCNDIKPEAEKWNQNSTKQPATKPAHPIRVKSKSCQNLSLTPLTPSGYRSVENVENGVIGTASQTKRLRYPHVTAADRTAAVNVCDVLNFNEGEIKANDRPLVNHEIINPRLDQALPSAIQSLLLPKQQTLVFNGYRQIPTYCCNHLRTTNAADYWDLGVFNQNENGCWTANGAFDSDVTQVANHETCKTIMKSVKTVVPKKLSTFFRKLTFTQSDRKKKDLVMTASVVAPPKEKNENIHLFKRAQ